MFSGHDDDGVRVNASSDDDCCKILSIETTETSPMSPSLIPDDYEPKSPTYAPIADPDDCTVEHGSSTPKPDTKTSAVAARSTSSPSWFNGTPTGWLSAKPTRETRVAMKDPVLYDTIFDEYEKNAVFGEAFLHPKPLLLASAAEDDGDGGDGDGGDGDTAERGGTVDTNDSNLHVLNGFFTKQHLYPTKLCTKKDALERSTTRSIRDETETIGETSTIDRGLSLFEVVEGSESTVADAMRELVNVKVLVTNTKKFTNRQIIQCLRHGTDPDRALVLIRKQKFRNAKRVNWYVKKKQETRETSERRRDWTDKSPTPTPRVYSTVHSWDLTSVRLCYACHHTKHRCSCPHP